MAEEGLGPVQVLVVGFEDASFEGGVLAELRRLRERDAICLIGLIFVAKDELGDVAEVRHRDLSAAEATELGALAAALIGLGADGEDGSLADAPAASASNGFHLDTEDIWYLADAIPPGKAAAVALIEHRWAIPLRDAIEGAGGRSLLDSWVHPEDLAAIGAARGHTET